MKWDWSTLLQCSQQSWNHLCFTFSRLMEGIENRALHARHTTAHIQASSGILQAGLAVGKLSKGHVKVWRDEVDRDQVHAAQSAHTDSSRCVRVLGCVQTTRTCIEKLERGRNISSRTVRGGEDAAPCHTTQTQHAQTGLWDQDTQ